jgi:hypothetical protein
VGEQVSVDVAALGDRGVAGRGHRNHGDGHAETMS